MGLFPFYTVALGILNQFAQLPRTTKLKNIINKPQVSRVSSVVTRRLNKTLQPPPRFAQPKRCHWAVKMIDAQNDDKTHSTFGGPLALNQLSASEGYSSDHRSTLNSAVYTDNEC